MKKLALSPQKSSNRRPLGSERGVILLLACFSMPVLIGMLGLGIDLSVMYSLKAKLQMACDGSAVAAIRALSLAQDTAAQTTMAQSIATQWFNANFAGDFLGATGTSAPIVTVTDLASVRQVTVTANTNAPTYFMKYWGRAATPIGASGQVSRRDVTIMMVLDRSGSMASGSYGGLTACQVMVQAAKQFTGMFQQGRDRIGLVTYGDTVQIVQSPTLNFQSALGYSNTSGSSTGALDSITCGGGTNTSSALSVGWNELYKMQLPGALNTIVLFTDGTPTAGTFGFVVPASVDPTGAATSAVAATSGCQDSSGVAMSAGGNMVTRPRNWVGREANSGNAVTFGANSYFADVTGPVSEMYGDGIHLYGLSPFFTPAGNSLLDGSFNTTTESPGCGFTSTNYPGGDLAFLPPTDNWGNSTTGYRTGFTTSYVQGANRIAPVNPANVGTAVFNLADNAASFARNTHVYSNGVAMPATLINTIGLGGTGGVDFTLLQRIANDPKGDSTVPYAPYPGYNTTQPVGQFLYSADANDLKNTFVKLGSQILRISR